MKSTILLIFTLMLGSSLFAQPSNPYYAPPFEIVKTDKLLCTTPVSSATWFTNYYRNNENDIIINLPQKTYYYNGINLGNCYANSTGGAFKLKIDTYFSSAIDISCMEKSPNMEYGLGNQFELANGDIMYIGYTSSSINDIGFELRDNQNNVKSYKTIGGYHSEKPFTIKRSIDGGYVGIADYTGYGDGDIGGNDSIKCGDYFDKDLWLFKTDSVGNVIKSWVFGGLFVDTHGDLHIADNGDITFAATVLRGGIDCDLGGCIAANTGWGDNASDIMIVQLDKDFNLLWYKCYGGSGIEGTLGDSKLVSDGAGGFYIATRSSSSDGDMTAHPYDGVPERTFNNPNFGSDLWVFHIDNLGTILESKRFPFNMVERMQITRSLDGHIWVAAFVPTDARIFSNLTNSDTCRKTGNVILHLDSSLELLHSRTILGMPHALIPLADSSILISTGFYPNEVFCHQDLMPLHDTTRLHPSTNGLALLKVRGRTATNIPEAPLDAKIRIYPNPVHSGQLHIDFDTPKQVLLQLTDASGRTILHQNLSEKRNIINVSHLASGMYIANLVDAQSKRKLISQKVTIYNS